MSLPNPVTLKELPAQSAAEFEDDFLHPQTGNPVQVSSSWRRTKRTFNVTWIYDHLHSDGTVERQTVEIVHQMIPAETYFNDFQRAGLNVIGVFGDFDRSTYREASPHLIIQAKN